MQHNQYTSEILAILEKLKEIDPDNYLLCLSNIFIHILENELDQQGVDHSGGFSLKGCSRDIVIKKSHSSSIH